MKNFKLLLSIGVVIFALVFTTSCKKDDGDDTVTPTPTVTKPTLGENFSFTVNANTVTFTTTLSGNVWIKNETTEVTTAFNDGTCTIFLPFAGDYPFTCQTLVDGQTVSSDEFSVGIEQDDVSYLDEGMWKLLSGGVGKTKTWKMDMNSEGYCSYFEGPLYYSGYAKDDVALPYWAWDVYELPYTIAETGDVMESYFNWSPDYPGNTWIMAAMDYGTITFSGNDLVATTEKFGVSETGSFTFDTTTYKIQLTGVTLPTDTARINEGQVEEWGNIRVFSLSDSAMQLGLKRVYEGFNEDGSQIESRWTLVYNFIVADYEYSVPETFTYEESYDATFTADDLVGTWHYGEVPMGWIAWEKIGNQGTNYPPHLFEPWYTREDVVTTLTSWGASFADSLFTANDAREYVFNADGTCNLDGVENTFSVVDGIISFGTPLTGDEFNGVWINLTGDLKIVDFDKMGPETALVDTPPFPGIWLGTQNDAKSEYKAVQLVKVE